jgi:hypothetical protein
VVAGDEDARCVDLVPGGRSAIVIFVDSVPGADVRRGGASSPASRWLSFAAALMSFERFCSPEHMRDELRP